MIGLPVASDVYLVVDQALDPLEEGPELRKVPESPLIVVGGQIVFVVFVLIAAVSSTPPSLFILGGQGLDSDPDFLRDPVTRELLPP